MEVLTIIWFLSDIWALFFMPWCADHKIELHTALFAVLCPGLNTAFAAYRTYRWIKDGFNINFIKDLFGK